MIIIILYYYYYFVDIKIDFSKNPRFFFFQIIPALTIEFLSPSTIRRSYKKSNFETIFYYT